MPPVTLSKGIQNGFLPGEEGWDDEMNANLARLNAFAVDEWAHDVNTTSGLTFGFRGGRVWDTSGIGSIVAGGSVLLSASITNYVERTPAGVVSSNTVGFTSTSFPMAKVLTNSLAVVSVEDWRSYLPVTASGRVHPRVIRAGNADIASTSAITAAINGPVEVRKDSDTDTLLVTAQNNTVAILNPVWIRATNGIASAVMGIAVVGGISQVWIGSLTNSDVVLHRQGSSVLAYSTNYFTPTVDDGVDLGLSSLRWRTAWVSDQLTVGTMSGSQGVRSELGFKGGSDGLTYTDGTTIGVAHIVAGTVRVGAETSHNLELVTNATARWRVNTDGHFVAFADDEYDIGLDGDKRPRSIYTSGRAKFAGVTGTQTSFVAPVEITVTTGATAIDLLQGNTFELELEATTTLTLNNPTHGAFYTFIVLQDATGGRGLGLPAGIRWSGEVAPVFGSTGGKINVFSLYRRAAGWLGFVGSVSA